MIIFLYVTSRKSNAHQVWTWLLSLIKMESVCVLKLRYSKCNKINGQ